MDRFHLSIEREKSKLSTINQEFGEGGLEGDDGRSNRHKKGWNEAEGGHHQIWRRGEKGRRTEDDHKNDSNYDTDGVSTLENSAQADSNDRKVKELRDTKKNVNQTMNNQRGPSRD